MHKCRVKYHCKTDFTSEWQSSVANYVAQYILHNFLKYHAIFHKINRLGTLHNFGKNAQRTLWLGLQTSEDNWTVWVVDPFCQGHCRSCPKKLFSAKVQDYSNLGDCDILSHLFARICIYYILTPFIFMITSKFLSWIYPAKLLNLYHMACIR